jgi:hypothetical protein
MISMVEGDLRYLELGGYGAVDEEVGGEVEHDEEVSHALCQPQPDYNHLKRLSTLMPKVGMNR